MVTGMIRLRAVIVAATITLWVTSAGLAGADPGQPPLPTPSEGQACEQAWVQSAPNDPRVSMRYGLGSVMFYGWVQSQCNGPDAKFPNGAAVAGSGLEPDVPAWQKLPPAAPVDANGPPG